MKNNFNTSKGSIHYQFISKGAPKNLLLMHGFMEDSEIWNELIPHIDANIILVDLLGFGKSIPNVTFNFSMQQHAQAVHELLTFLMPANLFIIGHSMGGYIALELSKLQQNIHIGLLHSTCLADTDERKNNRNKTIEVLERDASIFIREFYWNLFAEHHKNTFAGEIEYLKQKAEKIPTPYIIKTVQALRDRNNHYTTWQQLTGNQILIGGTFDKLLPVHELEELADMGNAYWVEMTNSAHMGFYEEPDVLIGVISDWVND